MPSVKRGTVASDLERAVKEARGGLDWKGDGKGVVRAGTVAFLLASSLPLPQLTSLEISYAKPAIGRVRPLPLLLRTLSLPSLTTPSDPNSYISPPPL